MEDVSQGRSIVAVPEIQNVAAETKPIAFLDLPEEIREMVLQHLDAEDRLEAVETCPAFYETICYLDRDKKLVLNDTASKKL